MPTTSLQTGKRLSLTAFAESPDEGIETGIQLDEQAEPPDSATLKPTDVIVEVKSTGVTFVDLLMLSGQYQHKPPLPYVPGLEYAGVVAWAGDAVDPRRIKIGDRVMNDFITTGPRSSGAYQQQGGWATYAVAPQDGVLPIPAGFGFDQACNLVLNYETAYYALITRANLQPGETVLINGASGAAGMAAIQVGKILGAKVIATGRSDAKLAVAKSFGADHVINTSPVAGIEGVPRFRDEVKALTGGRGAHVVYDTVGSDVSLECMRSLGFGGRLIIVGWAGNTRVAQGGGRRGSANAEMLPTNIMQMKGLAVMGSPMVIANGQDPSLRPPRLAKILEWVAEGRVTPYVSHTFPMSEFRAALRAKFSGQVIGGCVMHPD